MRFPFVFSLAALVLASGLVGDVDAARKPTPSERAAVTLAAIEAVPHVKGFAALFLIRRVAVSTVKPGTSSTFSSFAAAFGVAKDQSGLYPPRSRIALVGRHRRTRSWIAVDYGTSRVGCHEPQGYFGGRRVAILRDLGLRCQRRLFASVAKHIAKRGGRSIAKDQAGSVERR